MTRNDVLNGDFVEGVLAQHLWQF